MRVNLRVASALGMIFVLLLSTTLPTAAESNSLIENNIAVFTAIDFVSNIETIGVAVSGTGLSPTAELFYRQSGQSLWHAGHYLVRIDDGRLIGSLFNLSPATSYDVKVSDGVSEINGSVSTQPDELSFTPSTILNVDDNASTGGDGSAAAPFRTIQEAVDHAVPGTQVLVADGIYREAVTFPSSGTSENWIQVKAAGSAVILDSADLLSGNIWTLSSTSHVWFKQINGPVAYVARDGKRYYQYETQTGLNQAIGHGNVSINEGWFYEPSTLRLYVRSLDNPANHTWQVPRLNHAFDVTSHDWIWIEGFEIRFYGITTNGCGVCTLNTSHLVIRNNKIHNMQLGIFVNWNGTNDQGNDSRIEGNEVSDPKAAEWPWVSVKGSTMEGTGILVRGHIGAIARDNIVHDFFNGIFTGSSATGVSENPEFAFDVDVYHNYIHHIMDDALEPEGACVNNRFRHNTIDWAYVGFSIAPITVGPTWFLRNTFANYTGRGIKFASNSDGMVLIYQNTGWTGAANVNGADLITSIHNVVMRNNIFQTAAYSFAEVPTGSSANNWNDDNWYTTRGSAGPHFKWENVNYNTMAALCTASGLECNGYEGVPGFIDPTGGDFTLLSSSPNIDHGVVIPGINDDFVGSGPDVGAYESIFNAPPVVLSSIRTNLNPTNVTTVGFAVSFSRPVTGVDSTDFKLTTSGVTGASIIDVIGSGTTYTVTVNTGSGNGTVRLDVVDDNTIIDAANNPLGGVNVGDGNFTSGEVYTIIKPLLPSPWIGGVSITSDQNIVTVGRPHIGSEVASYDGFAAGSLASYVPMLFKNAYGSYESALYVQNVNASNTANITIKFYDNAGTLSCTKTDTITALASKGYWLGSESCLLAGWVGGAVVTSDQPIVTVGRPHVGNEVMTYDGFPSGSLTSYIPMLFNNYYGYNAAFYVQNVHANNTANITIKYYDNTGHLNCTKTDTIAPFASKGYWVPSASCDTGSGSVPAGWAGGVVVTSDQPIVGVGRPHIGSQVTTYNGFTSGGLSSYVPMLFKGAFGGSYDSAYYIQNTDASNTANITIKYYDNAGVLKCTKTDTISPLASKGYWVPTETCDTNSLPAGWVGGIVVTSDQLIVGVGRPHIGAEVLTYDGFASGSLNAYVPMMFKDAFGSYNSALYIQNIDPGNTANVTIRLYDASGNLACTVNDSLSALATKGYWVPSLVCTS